ncbi:protease, partial [Candidatus Saccharibacteria bacterium]|nr:protease [Candidatus Saccharibacteria bacterium]
MMYKQIAANKRNTILIMLGFVVLIGLIGGVFAFWFKNYYTLIYFLVFGTIYVVFQYFMSGTFAVAMTGAKEIKKSDNPRLYNAVENLAITTGLPMPKVYIIEDSAPNA